MGLRPRNSNNSITRKQVGAECRHDMRPSVVSERLMFRRRRRQYIGPNNGVGLVCSRRRIRLSLIGKYDASFAFLRPVTLTFNLFKRKNGTPLYLLVPWGKSVPISIFKPPPPLGAGGGCFRVVLPCVRACVRPCVRASVRDSRGSFMFLRYLQYLLTDFRQTFVTGASCDTDDLITFLGQKVKVQGHTIAAEAHSTRRYRRVQLFLVLHFVFEL